MRRLTAGLAGTAAALLAAPASAQFAGFTPRTDYPVPAGDRPTDSVVADLDNDGDLDIAVTLFTPDSIDRIAVFFNNGDGTFSAPSFTSVGDSPTSIATADMDSDGFADLLCANRGTGDYSVRLGNGDGTFQAEIFLASGNEPQGIATADFNNDGRLDIVVSNRADDTVSVFFGNGDGTTGPANTWSTNNGGGTQGDNPRDVIAADLNFDGLPDIVTANALSGTGTVLYNVAAAPGTFFTGNFATFVAAGTTPVSIETDDLGPDGDPDLIFASTNGDIITRFNETSEGAAPFPSFPSSNTIGVGGRPVGIAIADFDDLEVDGDDDIVVADELGNRIVVLINTGNAIYANAGSFTTAGSPQDPTVADLDGDGDDDVVVPHFNGNSVGVFLNANTIVGGPPPVVELVSPGESACLCPSFVGVTATIDAAPGTVAGAWSLEFRRLGTDPYITIAQGSGEASGETIANWDISGLSEGNYILRLTAENSGGISASDESTVFVSQNFGGVNARLAAGISSVGEVGSATIVGRNACVFGGVSDNGCGPIVYQVDYRPASGGSFEPVDPATPTYTGGRTNSTLAVFDTTTVPDGDYVMRVFADNDCGQDDQVVFPFTVDNTPPVGKIDTPENCDFLNPGPSIEIRGSAFDANLSGWSLQYTGGNANGWVTIASGNTGVVDDVLAVWDTSGLPPCSYTLRLTVNDRSVTNCGAGGQGAGFLTSINIGCRADLAEPFNVLDLSDINAFVASFTAGCP